MKKMQVLIVKMWVLNEEWNYNCRVVFEEDNFFAHSFKSFVCMHTFHSVIRSSFQFAIYFLYV